MLSCGWVIKAETLPASVRTILSIAWEYPNTTLLQSPGPTLNQPPWPLPSVAIVSIMIWVIRKYGDLDGNDDLKSEEGNNWCPAERLQQHDAINVWNEFSIWCNGQWSNVNCYGALIYSCSSQECTRLLSPLHPDHPDFRGSQRMPLN